VLEHEQTYWQEGNDRETALANGAFKPLIDAGAKLLRHDKELESVQSIMSELIHTTPMMMNIQEELNAGRALGDISAGAVIIEEIEKPLAADGEHREWDTAADELGSCF
jgi:hypothetical protein